jgi:hypothetical protein
MEIEIPEKLQPLVKAFSVESEAAAKILITEATRALCGSADICISSSISNEEIEGVCALMRGVKPKDTIEAIFAAQIVASHLLGLRLLSKSYGEDQALGLRLLKHCNEALAQLEKRRSGDVPPIQTINAEAIEE